MSTYVIKHNYNKKFSYDCTSKRYNDIDVGNEKNKKK